jgi:hypothetical protein
MTKVEENVFETIDEIADELEIKVKCYPEVYLLNSHLNFDDLFLDEKYREEFDDCKTLKSSIYIDRPPIILLGRNNIEDISEESAHFLHFRSSGIKFSGRKKQDTFALNIIVELVAYFCSKLIVPSRKNEYSDTPDLFFMTPEKRKEFLQKLSSELKGYDSFVNTEFYLYQQARGLGERMYYAYLEDKLTMKDFRKLFLEKFEGKITPSEKLLRLKAEFWMSEEFKQRARTIILNR